MAAVTGFFVAISSLGLFLPCVPAPGEASVADFLLESADGKRVSLQAPPSIGDTNVPTTLTVLALLDVDCPVTLQIAQSLAECERTWRDHGVRFLGIATARAASPAAIAEFASACDLEFPLLRDPLGVVAERLGAGRSGEVIVLDVDFREIYRGASDDRFEGGTAKERASNDYLADAIESALAGETVEASEIEAGGAAFDLAAASSAPAITFHRDVAPILHAHCAECHRPGQVGPMALLDFDDASGWAPMIAEVVGAGRMPPWHADPRHGRFKNERRLTETEKKTLELWAASGAKAGDPKDAPPRPTFADPEWTIGKPDFVFELPEEQSIPAEGVLAYRYVPLDPGFTEDHWIQAVEVRPTARAATHHVIAYLLAPGVSPKDALKNPESIFQLDGLGGYAPGSTPLQLQDGQGFKVAKGSTLLFELHYTPVGKAMADRTRIGLRKSRVPVTRVVETGAAMNFSFRIPPREDAATFKARHRFQAPAEILTLTPHMHMRGKAFRYELARADGRREVLLDVPKYDFNWQHTYVLETPVPAGAGDVLHVTAVFDNSTANPFNPNPDKWVTWGDQTFEEMLIGYFDYVQARDAKE